MKFFLNMLDLLMFFYRCPPEIIFSCKDAAQQVHLCLSLSVCLWSPLPDMTADDSLTPDDSLLMVGQIAGDS